MNWAERSLELRLSSHKTPAHSRNAHGCFVRNLPLSGCWDPPGSLHTQQASIALLYMGVFLPAMGQSPVMYTIPWKNVQVPGSIKIFREMIALILQTACSQQQGLIVKKAIISANSPDTIPRLRWACPEHFWSTAMKGLSDAVRLENTGFSEVTFTCCRNSWAFEAYGKFLKEALC